jgi:hypothetical protein
MKVYIVVELNKKDVPKIIGTYKDKKKAESVSYESGWRNVITQDVL